MIRVVHLSSTEATGGAALAARRLHSALNASGQAQSTMFVGLAQHPGAEVKEFHPVPFLSRGMNRWLYRVGRRLGRRVTGLGGTPFSQEWTSFGRLPLLQLPPADVYHLHWTADLLDFRMLLPLARRAAVFWTLHDMNPFTGGCHYDEDCGRFAAACGCCPRLASSDPADPSAGVLRRKKRILAAIPDDGITVVCPSRWMASESRRSSVFGRFAAHVVPNGVDLETFRPVDRDAVRARLGLEADARIVLFVAESLDDGRKGYEELEKALAKLTGLPRLRVLTLGNGDIRRMSGPEFVHYGHLSDLVAIRDIYNAADLFVIPSLQDNFPNTMIEALACGTPVVGFATGGVADAVEHGGCGLLAPTGDTAELGAHMVRVLTDDALRATLATAARARAVELYGLARQAQTCLELYGARLAEHSRPPRAKNALVAADPIVHDLSV